jgi:hypothetical protein
MDIADCEESWQGFEQAIADLKVDGTPSWYYPR